MRKLSLTATGSIHKYMIDQRSKKEVDKSFENSDSEGNLEVAEVIIL